MSVRVDIVKGCVKAVFILATSFNVYLDSRVNENCQQVRMLTKRRGENPTKKRQSVAEGAQSASDDPVLRLAVAKILMRDYEANHLDKERLRHLATPFGVITISCSADLEQVRSLVKELLENNYDAAATRKSDSESKTKSDWVFIDSVTAVRFFRIDKAQENLHYVTDVCDERVLYILDEENEEDETFIDQVRNLLKHVEGGVE